MPTITRRLAIDKNYPIGSYFIQTILIPDSYTKKQAIAWLVKKGLRHDYYRKTEHFHRFMQHNPVEKARYYTERIPNNVEIVYQKFT